MGVRLLFRIFTLAGLGMLAGGCYSAWNMRQFLHNAARTQGTVIDNIWRESSSEHSRSMSAYPQVRYYKADGGIILFTSGTGTNPPAFHLNQPVTVLYDPQNPYRAYIDSFGQLWMLPMILLGMGLGFCVPEACYAAVRRAGARKEEWLRQNGRRIEADITEVGLNQSFEVNGVHPHRIICQWQDPVTQQVHVFHSANIWYDPSKFLPGKTLEVLVDRDNPRRYSVQTPFLPKKA